MDDLFSKALDVLEPLQSKVSSALDSTLNEYPKPGEDSLSTLSTTVDSKEDFGFSHSALDGAKRVLSYWEELDLENTKVAWDQHSLGISQNQDISMKNRKSLAELTKAFRSGDKKDVAPLLKAYQGEIDSLTKRAKHAEGSYLGIYQLLYDAPDVVPSLRAFVAMAERVTATEQEARRYRQELEIFKREANSAKNLQSTLRRLEERNAELEESLDAKVAAIVEQKQKEIEKSLEAAQEREATQQALLEETRESLTAMQKQHDRTQTDLFDLRAKMEEERASKQHELEAASEEIERAQERVRSLEMVRQDLAVELEKLRMGGGGDSRLEGEAAHQQFIHEMENSLLSKEKLITSLQDQIQQLETSFSTEKERQDNNVVELEAALEEEREMVEALKIELATRPNIEQLEELRKQNRVLQELVGSDVDEWDKMDGFEEPDENSEAVKVQRALRETNRKLTAELTSIKIALSEKQNEGEVLIQRLKTLEDHTIQLEALVARLEEDIMKGSEVQVRRDGWKDGSQAITGLLTGGSEKDDDLASPRGNTTTQSEGTMLEIVCGQRERFRRRAKELELENGGLQENLNKNATEIQRLKNDNVNLYEKIKYLEQYNRQSVIRRVGGPQGNGEVMVFGGGAGTKGSRYACFGVSEPGSGLDVQGHLQDNQVSAPGGTEMRYRKLYEERMNPFNEFHNKEKERSYRDLRLHDKITLTGSRFLLSNKYGRMFVFCYTILLHVFVFFVLYRSSHPRTVVIQPLGVGGRGIPEIFFNETMDGNMGVANTLSDKIAEQVGTLMQKTRDITNQ